MIKIISRIILLLLVIFGLIYGYYWAMQQHSTSRTDLPMQNIEELKRLSDQEGAITLSGKIIAVDNSYYLELENNSRVQLRQSKISLVSYAGKTVEVSGSFSGDSLVVGKIQEL